MLRDVALASGGTRKFHFAGWHRDKIDHRDRVFVLHAPLSVRIATLPKHSANRPYCSPVFDQGELGSCTANAFATIIEYNDIRFGKLPVGRDGHPTFTRVSRLAHYYWTRHIEHTEHEDSGATIRDTIKAGMLMGCTEEVLWPYDISKFTLAPPKPAVVDASTHKIKDYYRVA